MHLSDLPWGQHQTRCRGHSSLGCTFQTRNLEADPPKKAAAATSRSSGRQQKPLRGFQSHERGCLSSVRSVQGVWDWQQPLNSDTNKLPSIETGQPSPPPPHSSAHALLLLETPARCRVGASLQSDTVMCWVSPECVFTQQLRDIITSIILLHGHWVEPKSISRVFVYRLHNVTHHRKNKMWDRLINSGLGLLAFV